MFVHVNHNNKVNNVTKCLKIKTLQIILKGSVFIKSSQSERATNMKNKDSNTILVNYGG